MSVTTDLRTAAKMEYQERMKERLNLTPTFETRMMEDKPITQADLDAINANSHNYANRERIPEWLLVYSDLYHELTGQEMLKMDVSSYIEIFQEWKDRALQPDDIRGAWAQSKSDKGGFSVGHPRALTITANGMKSRAKPAIVGINSVAVERTQKMLEEKEVKYVSRPANLARPKGI